MKGGMSALNPVYWFQNKDSVDYKGNVCRLRLICGGCPLITHPNNFYLCSMCLLISLRVSQTSSELGLGSVGLALPSERVIFMDNLELTSDDYNCNKKLYYGRLVPFYPQLLTYNLRVMQHIAPPSLLLDPTCCFYFC